MDQPSQPQVIALIGAGRVGSAAAVLLQRAGHTVRAVHSRSSASAERAQRLLDTRVARSVEDAVSQAAVVLVGVTDPDIVDVATRVARTSGPDAVLVHFAGAFGVAPLTDLDRPVLALHPVQACPTVDAAVERLPGSVWGVTTTPGDGALGAALVNDMKGTPVLVPEEARPLWHAAAAVASNGMVAMIALGEQLLAHAGVDTDVSVLGPLVNGTLENVVDDGAGRALTGPVVRGDLSTLTRHLEVIARTAPELTDTYRDAVATIARAALTAERIDSETAHAVLELMRST